MNQLLDQMSVEASDSADDDIFITRFRTLDDTTPRGKSTTWAELQRVLLRHLSVVSKSDAPLWSPVRYSSRTSRGNTNVESISLLVADLDDGTDADTLRYWLERYDHLIVSTFSHSPAHPKLRAVVRLSKPIPASDYPETWRRANQHLFHGHLDPSTRDAARMYFVPSAPEGAERIALTHAGGALDWWTLPRVPTPRALTRVRLAGLPIDVSDAHKRAHALLGKWSADLAAMSPSSGRHNTLLRLARAAGGLVANGLLEQPAVIDALSLASERNGLVAEDGVASVERTLQAGLEHGQSAPWTPDDLPDSPTWRQAPRLRSQPRIDSVAPPVGPAETNLPWHTAYEIGQMVAPTTTWRAHGLLADGCITELDGKVKRAGKTTFILAMCSAIVQSEPFLGEPTLATPIVFLTEQAPRTFLQALRRAGLLERQDVHVLYWHDTHSIDWRAIVTAAVDKAKAVQAHVLIIDTLSQFVGLKGDAENSSGDALQAVQPLQEAVAGAHPLAVLFSRHERKSGGDVGDSGRGSSAFAGAVDIVLSLRRPDGAARPTLRVVYALSRFDETPDSLVVDLVDQQYRALGDESVLAAAAARMSILEELPGGLTDARTADDLLAAADVRRTLGKRILSELLKEGLLERTGQGKRGDPFRYFRGDGDQKSYSAGLKGRSPAETIFPLESTSELGDVDDVEEDE